MSKISCLINKKLIKTILSSSCLVSITKPPLKTSNFLTPILNFSRNLTPRQNFISSSLSHAGVINLSFNPNPRSFCSISSPHREIEVNQKIPSSSEKANEVSIPDLEATLSDSSHSYMVVFPYGSTVTFNMLDDEVDGYLEIIKRHASGLLETSKDGASFQNYHIKYEVRENSNLPMWMQGGQGYVMLQQLDIDGVRVVSSVLGQSIALDYYVRKADGVIAAFTELPRARWTIRSNIMRKKRMNQLVGSANSTLAELMVKVGLFDRSEITFREDPNYSQMFEYLKDQFEFNQKFVGLDFYLRLMETYIVFIGAETNRRYVVLSHGLINLYGCLVYFFSPFIPALGSLIHTIIVKTGVNMI